jgi:uncharacterized UPF0146 family protein
MCDEEQYIAHYIKSHFQGKVVEVGVGKRTGVMDMLREMGMEVIGVDVNPIQGVVFDDIYRPNISIY